MRVVRFRHEGHESMGFVRGDSVIPAPPARGQAPRSVAELMTEGLPTQAQLAAAPRTVPLQEIEFLIPSQSAKVLCAGVNFPTHRVETGRDAAKPATPTIFTRFIDSFVPHQSPLLKPAVSDQFDYECELAIVIGSPTWQVPVESALDHVFGYSCLNDGTVRDWQAHTAQWTPGKNWYRSGSIGPWIVTADEFGLPAAQRIQTRVNGEVRQSAVLAEMIHSVAELVAYCSTFTPLSPGDIIAGGTTGGVGKFMDPPGYLRHGDVVEIEIDGIGTLTNPVTQAASMADELP